MSEGINRVILLGYTGGDPDLKFTNAGTPMLTFRMATHERWMDKNRQLQERTEWHSVIVWGPRAESLSKVLAKGSCVAVEGSLRTQAVEKDGHKRYYTEVHAREVYVMNRRPEDAKEADAAPAPASAPRPRRANTLVTGTDPVQHEEMPY